MTLGSLILRIMDRQRSIHFMACDKRGLPGDIRRNEFRRRFDHVDRMMWEMLPRYFPQFYCENGQILE